MNYTARPDPKGLTVHVARQSHSRVICAIGRHVACKSNGNKTGHQALPRQTAPQPHSEQGKSDKSGRRCGQCVSAKPAPPSRRVKTEVRGHSLLSRARPGRTLRSHLLLLRLLVHEVRAVPHRLPDVHARLIRQARWENRSKTTRRHCVGSRQDRRWRGRLDCRCRCWQGRCRSLDLWAVSHRIS